MTILDPYNWLKGELVLLLARITPQCKEIKFMISESMDRTLPLRQRLVVWLHKKACVCCRRYSRYLQFIRDNVREFPNHINESSNELLSLDAKERIKKALHEWRK